MNFILVLLLWSLNYSSAQDANCDYSVNVAVGQSPSIRSPNYPGSYRPGQTCRWIVNCPTGYNCRLDCSEIRLPFTQSCTGDRMLVSKIGDPQLYSAESYCGTGSLSVVSTYQTISIGLITTANSVGGRFMCTVTPQVAQPPNQSCSCGVRRQNRIVGGQETGVNEFTMMAALADGRTRQITCGAVIISARDVLTAAHCLINEVPANFAVVVGEHDVTIGDTAAAAAYRISGVIIHPSYNSNNYDNDIAIVRVQTNIAFSDRVLPVCLPFRQHSNSFAGSKVTVVGWGTTFPGGPTSNVPLKADLDVLLQSTCRSSGAQVTDRQMCTFTRGKDACQYDSGGPALWTNPNNGLLYHVGIISYGSFCASNTPGIFTRVTSYLDWIVANTPTTNYCYK